MIDFNFLTLAPEATTSLRKAKSGTLSEVEIQPELFDFAGILGGFVNPAQDLSLAIPELADEHAATEARAAHSLVSNGGDKAELMKLPDLDLLRLPSIASPDVKALELPALSDQRFAAISSAPFDGGASAAAVCDQPVATDQSGIANGCNQWSDPMTVLHLSDSANRISSSVEVVSGGLPNSTQPLNHDVRKKIDGDTMVRRMDVNIEFALQAETALDSALPPAAISLAIPMLPSPMSTQSKPISWTDFRFTANADTGLPTMSHDPATILGFGELLGVAGKLRFARESAPTSLEHGLDSPSVTTQGGQSPILLHQAPSPLQQQVISTPLSSLHWPTVFSSSIVRLATEQLTQANLTVTPDHLGTISITIALEGSKVSIGFNAENSEVRQAVNASLPVLQDLLEKSGLSLGQSSVGHEAPRNANPDNFRQTKDSQRESDAIPVIPAKPVRILLPEARAGRVDFFA